MKRHKDVLEKKKNISEFPCESKIYALLILFISSPLFLYCDKARQILLLNGQSTKVCASKQPNCFNPETGCPPRSVRFLLRIKCFVPTKLYYGPSFLTLLTGGHDIHQRKKKNFFSVLSENG